MRKLKLQVQMTIDGFIAGPNGEKWNNTTLAKDLVGEINQLKKEPGKDMIAYGGGNFVSNLVKNNLIDEYHLFINPSAIGEGMPIFAELKNILSLTAVKTTTFPCGITVLHFESPH